MFQERQQFHLEQLRAAEFRARAAAQQQLARTEGGTAQPAAAAGAAATAPKPAGAVPAPAPVNAPQAQPASQQVQVPAPQTPVATQ